MASRQYDFILPATQNAFREIQASGSQCKLIGSISGSVTVVTDQGSRYELLEGQGFTMPPGENFRSLFIYNPRAVATVGSIFVGDATFKDDRVSGSVEVVDGERNKVLAGLCYTCALSVAGAVGAPRIQIFNAGTGRALFINAVRIGALNADNWGLVTCTNIMTAAQGLVGMNLDSNAPGSNSAAFYTDNTAAPLTAARNLKVGYLPASTDIVVIMPKPVLLRPGNGLIAYSNSTANTIRATFEFEEWPI